MGGPAPKQLLELGGMSVLRRSLETFDRHPSVTEIVIVLHESLMAGSNAHIGPIEKPHAIVAGGARRQDSVANGVMAVNPEADIVLVHDAARPFVSAPLIDRVIEAAARDGAAVPAVRVRETVKRVDAASRVVAATIPRDEVWLAQTPQGFRRDLLAKAIAGNRHDEATDESMLLERGGSPVTIVEGDSENVKITTPEDLEAARLRMAGSAAGRVGTGYDLHRLEQGRPLVLAGVVVPFERGPVAHSDGDVLCHALIDAMLGAAGAGDIGRHFPNTDAAWKNAPGLELLSRAVTIVGDLGWSVTNADVTIVLERPRLAPHISDIRNSVAGVLQVTPDRVSVKGKTNEGVDAVGRGEAIAAHAAVMLHPVPGVTR
jgi:2-C-methyl-D-erythritol 4-phosphate cytidylyltransferase/2-C-methyl-D-erythritol 2,4-cyclodiphosphate synthase